MLIMNKQKPDDRLAFYPLDAEEEDLEADLARLMAVWWPERSVGVLARRFAEAFVVAASRPAPTGPEGDEDPISRMIVCGERLMRDWTP